MDELLKQLAASGPLGIVAAIAMWVAYKKDQQLQALYAKMFDNANKERELTNTLARELSRTVGVIVEYSSEEEG